MERLLIESFANVVIAVDAASDIVESEKIAGWLSRYFTFFADRLGMGNGHNLHHLYNRTISVVGRHMYKHYLWPTAIVTTGLSHGIGPSITVDFADVYHEAGDISHVLRQWRGAKVVLDLQRLSELNSCKQSLAEIKTIFAAIVEVILSERMPFCLIACGSDLQSIDAFNLYGLNSATFQVIQPTRQIVVGDPAQTREPCRGKLSLFIGNDGGVYPCATLIGRRGARLGSIDCLVVTDELFEKPQLDFIELSKNGPDLSGLGAANIAGTTCARHLARLQVLDPDNWVMANNIEVR
jgi:hypothetical protein